MQRGAKLLDSLVGYLSWRIGLASGIPHLLPSPPARERVTNIPFVYDFGFASDKRLVRVRCSGINMRFGVIGSSFPQESVSSRHDDAVYNAHERDDVHVRS